mgnify:CR=1 FL=1
MPLRTIWVALSCAAYMSLLVLFYINIPNGTLHLDEADMVFLISCGIAMIGSLPFHAWLNWVWYKKVSS